MTYVEYSDKPVAVEFDCIAGFVYRRTNIRQIEKTDEGETRLVWVADEEIVLINNYLAEQQARIEENSDALLEIDGGDE